jgi:tetratricopeptide (TPR) repeat protein
MLLQTVGYYEKLLAESGQDPVFQNEISRVAYLAGLTLRDLGRLEDAVATFQAGLHALDEIERHTPPSMTTIERRVDLMMVQGDALRNLQKFDEARPLFEQAIALSQPHINNSKASKLLRRSFAQAKMQLGSLAKENQDVAACVAMIGDGAGLLRELSNDFPDDLDLRGDFGQALDHLGAAQLLSGDTDAAERTITECLDVQQELWRLQPRSLRAQLAVARSFGRLGDVEEKRGRLSEAIDFNRKSAEVYDEAASRCPHIPQVHRDYANLLAYQAGLFEKQKNYTEAYACWERAALARLRLVELQPTSTRRRLELAQTCYLQGRMALACKNIEAAKLAIKRARIQFDAVRPTISIPELVKDMQTLEGLVDQLEKHVNGQKVDPPKPTSIID